MVADDVIQTRSESNTSEANRDQYADGRAAKVWEVYIGDRSLRTENYKNFLLKLLRSHGCHRILDVACGTGVDSTLLIEENFDVVSTDASEQMLKYARKERASRRTEAGFDTWIIEKANWLTLPHDVGDLIGDGFDAIICLGNSFVHLLSQCDQITALQNFKQCLKPGGLLLIDHRNYDIFIDTGDWPHKSIYYNSTYRTNVKSTVSYTDDREPSLVTSDIAVKVNGESIDFRLQSYPHRLKRFNGLLENVFGSQQTHRIFGDFKPLKQHDKPSFYVHVIEKST